MTRRARLFGLLSIAALATPAFAQENSTRWDPQEILRAESYVKPPANLERMIMAPRVDISFNTPSPDRSWFLRTTGATRGDILLRGKEHVYLAGLEVDTKAHRARSLTTSNARGIVLVNPRTGTTKTIETPANAASISSATWSPDGKQIAYFANFDAASHVYVADVGSGKSTQVSRTQLLPVLVTDLEYTADGKSIVVVLPPDGRSATAPTHGPNNVENGPTVRFSDGTPRPQRIHASLLLDRHDKDALKYYTTGQLAVIDIKSRAVTKIGEPRMIRTVDANADGSYFTVTYMVEPFSYNVPANAFGTKRELWDRSGKVIATLASTPLREGGGGGTDDAPAFGGGGPSASDTGKRNVSWNPIGPGLLYEESVFGAPAAGNNRGAGPAGRGGPQGANQRRQPTSVRLMSWLPPFGPNDTRLVYEGGPALGTTMFSADGKMLFAADSGAVFAVRLADSKRFNLGRRVTLSRGGGGFGGGGGGGGGGGAGQNADTTALGGALVTRTLPPGRVFVVVSSDGKGVAVTGTRTPGASWSSQAPRPWVDKNDLETAQRSRLLDSPTDAFESLVAPLDDDFSQYLYTRENASTIADVWLRDVTANSTKQVTNNVDVGPEVSTAPLKRFRVTRPRDGYKFWADVTLPKSWRPGQKVPAVLWFYPREFTSQDGYDRSRFSTNINRFPEVPSARPASSTKLWVSQGYALIEPDIPIWGDSGKMNDNYTRDLRENLDAVVDAIVDSGWVDRNQLGIGGHSYGAFSTVNAMTLVPYFKAGIAGDGMYNRSLTPFGFQSERRSFFQAQDTYLDMSPFFRADKIAGALLLYHNWEDQNSGTAIISSQRMMMALQGLGKTAALYMYPYEDHSVAAYASDLDQWARWIAWMDTHVKNPKKPVP